MTSSLISMLPLSLPVIRDLDDQFTDCMLCDAGTSRVHSAEPMIQCVGDPSPDIVFITDPADTFSAIQGVPCISPQLDFILDTFNDSMEDIVASGAAPLSFAIVPVIGCSANCFRAVSSLSDTKCRSRAESFIEQLNPGLVIYLSKASQQFLPLSIETVHISGPFALSKLNTKDMEVRHVTDVLNIRKAICKIWNVSLHERSRSKTLDSF